MKNKTLLFSIYYSLLTITLPLTIYGQSTASNCTTIDYENYDLIFEDEFNNENESLNENWYHEFRHGPYNNWPQEFNVLHTNDSSVRWIEDGYLNLFIKNENPPILYDGLNFNFSAGMIRSNFDDNLNCSPPDDGVQYGMFEIRAKMGKGKGFKSSLWLRGFIREIDIIEYSHQYSPEKFGTNINKNISGVGYSCEAPVETGIDITEMFHIYTVIWTPYNVTWFFDGEEIRSVDDYIANGCYFAQSLKASVRLTETSGPIGLDSHKPLQVDYIRFYKRIDDLLPGKKSWEHFSISPDSILNVNSDLAINQNGNCFYRDFDNRMQYLYTTCSDNWQAKSMNNDVDNVAGDIVIDHSTGSIFYRGTDNRLWEYKIINGGWISNIIKWEANDVIGDLAVNQKGDIFYRSYNNQMSNLYRNTDGSWLKNNMSGINNVSGEITIDKSTGLIYYIGIDNSIWNCWQTNDGWQKSRLNFTPIVVDNLEISPINNKLIYFKGGSEIESMNNLFKIEEINGSWEVEQIFGTKYSYTWGHPCNETSACNNILIENVADDLVLLKNGHIYYKGTDSQVWEVYQKPDKNWYYQKINETPNNVFGCLVKGVDGSLFYKSSLNKAHQILPKACENILHIDYECGDVIDLSQKLNPQNNDFGDDSKICEDIWIYPNPTNEIIHVKISNYTEEDLSQINIRVFDSSGKLLFTKENQTIGSQSLITLSFKDFQSGLYFININIGGHHYTKAIIKS